MQEINLPQNFFEDEEIDGFLVSEEMKRAWAAELKVLIIFDNICRTNNIRYFAGYGTLLGAVRHKGFIPWDDDIDLIMLRDDYMKFVNIAYDKMPKSWDFHSVYHFSDHNQPFAAITNRRDISLEGEITANYYGCPYIVGMDVCALDYVPKDEELKGVHKMLYMAAYDLAQNYEAYEAKGEAEALLNQLEALANVSIDRNNNIKNQVWKMSENILMMFNRDESEYLVHATAYAGTENSGLSRIEWYDDTVYLPFTGGIKVPAPKAYHEVLVSHYGENYMNPVRYESHTYPFFKNQKNVLS